MPSNLDRYKKDLDVLLDKGTTLLLAMQAECHPKEFEKGLETELRNEHGDKSRDKAKKFLKDLPSFRDTYQEWYSEAKVLIRQVLPDRFADFVGHYEKPKSRKEITSENYRIEDYLQGFTVTTPWEKRKVVGP